MERDTKLGYGFLFVGYGMPFLVERLLGENAAIWTAVICSLLGVGFLIAGHFHGRKAARGIWKHVAAAALLVCGIAFVAWWIYAHPDMEAAIVGSATGEIVERLPHYDTGVGLNVDVLNSGPPSITKDWALSLELENGERFQGRIEHSRVTGWADDTGKILGLDLSNRQFIDQMTATIPIATGGRERGVLLFVFPDLPRERVDRVNNKLTLSFKDVRGRTFKTTYRFPASTAYITD